MFVEPNHYYSTMEPSAIRSHIHSCLLEMSIDVALTLFTFVCTSYVRHAATEFWISIYTDDKSSNGTRYIIEIQRRSGDGFGFCEVARAVKAYLTARGVIEAPVAPKKNSWGAKAKAKAAAMVARSTVASSSSASVAAAPVNSCEITYRSLSAAPSTSSSASSSSSLVRLSVPDAQVDEQALGDSVCHMLRVSAESEYEDVQAEALRTLADMSQESQTQRALLSADGMPVLLQCMTSGFPNVHRCATTVMANLIAGQGVCVCLSLLFLLCLLLLMSCMITLLRSLEPHGSVLSVTIFVSEAIFLLFWYSSWFCQLFHPFSLYFCFQSLLACRCFK